MGKIHYVNGDATKPIGEGYKIIAHVCNNVGAWGAGFVVAASNRWPITREEFKRISRNGDNNLGTTQFVFVERHIIVANMIAQNGINDGKKGWRGDLMDYNALSVCLDEVYEFADDIKANVHMPRIGCGLAGSSWDKIEPILLDVAGKYEVDCYVYDYKP